MKHSSFIIARFFFFFVFALLAISATAQFKKPLTSPRDRVGPSEAKWNIGLVGGANLTTWLHFNSSEASEWFIRDYKTFDSISPLTESLGYFGGIAAERMFKSNLSIGLNVVYAQHNVKLGYLDDHFPYDWDSSGDSILYGQIQKNFRAKYSAVEAYIPITYYIGLASTKSIKPYVYFAPRFSLVLPLSDSLNQMTYSAFYFDAYGDTISDLNRNETVPFNRSTYRMLNVGGTVGLGSLFKVNAGNYYLLFKIDVSANFYGLSTYKHGEIENDEFKYRRYSPDAHATITLMLPLKKQLQDACIKWGRYN